MEDRYIGCNFSGSDILFEPDDTHFIDCNFRGANLNFLFIEDFVNGKPVYKEVNWKKYNVNFTMVTFTNCTMPDGTKRTDKP